MTTPPPSPYGPPPSAAQPHGPQQQPAMFHPPYVPYGYSAIEPNPPKQSNSVGLTALVIGIVAVVVAFIPIFNFVAFLLGPAGIVLGIIGMALAERPKRAAAWGTVLSATSMGIAAAVVALFAFGFWSFNDGGVVANPAPQGGEALLASDPLPLGTMVTLTDAAGVPAYEVSITSSSLYSDGAIAALEDNTAAPAGMQWALAQVEVWTLSDIYSAPALDLTVEFVDHNQVSHRASDAPATAPGAALDSFVDVPHGEGAMGFVVIAIPEDNPTGGQWLIQLGSDSDDERYFFEVQ